MRVEGEVLRLSEEREGERVVGAERYSGCGDGAGAERRTGEGCGEVRGMVKESEKESEGNDDVDTDDRNIGITSSVAIIESSPTLAEMIGTSTTLIPSEEEEVEAGVDEAEDDEEMSVEEESVAACCSCFNARDL